MLDCGDRAASTTVWKLLYIVEGGVITLQCQAWPIPILSRERNSALRTGRKTAVVRNQPSPKDLKRRRPRRRGWGRRCWRPWWPSWWWWRQPGSGGSPATATKSLWSIKNAWKCEFKSWSDLKLHFDLKSINLHEMPWITYFWTLDYPGRIPDISWI